MAAFVQQGNTQIITADTEEDSYAVPPDAYQMVLWNRGANPVYVLFSKGAAAVAVTYSSSASNGIPIPPGAIYTVTKADANWMSVITDASTSILNATPGTGE